MNGVILAPDVTVMRQLFEASLAVDLGFQHFDQELVSLPGAYSSPRGALFLARADGLGSRLYWAEAVFQFRRRA
ncbi:MAG: hypothetical protein WAM53_07525 [Terrimicrobiaceae bacterium]